MNRTTSIYLDAIRPLMAFVVLLSHLGYKSITDGRMTVFEPFGVQAVDIFFVLSGFVIAHVCATREHSARPYGLSRAARICSVAYPALILTILFECVGRAWNAAPYSAESFQSVNPEILLRSIFFLGERWNAHSTPATNAPYWSLGFEVWYYVCFGVFCFAPGRWRWIGAAAVLAFIGPRVSLMFPIWLAGVGAYRFCANRRLDPALAWCLLLAPIATYAVFHLSGAPVRPQFIAPADMVSGLANSAPHYFIGLLFAIHLCGFSSLSAVFAPALDAFAAPIRWAAGATFSLYLAHMPTIVLLAAFSPFGKSSTANVVFLIAGSTSVCLLFAELSERRKSAWRYGIEWALLRARTYRRAF